MRSSTTLDDRATANNKQLPDSTLFLVARARSVGTLATRLAVTEMIIRRQATMLAGQKPKLESLIPRHFDCEITHTTLVPSGFHSS